MLEAKAKNRGHRRKCFPNKQKKNVSKQFFRRSPKEKNKKDLRKFSAKFLAFFNKILTIQKIVLSSSRGYGNFRELRLEVEAKDLIVEVKNFKICPRGRTRGQGRLKGLHL